jgi:hypothetical protein
LLVDGTHLKCFGPLGEVWRVHTAFDVLAGRLTQLKVTDMPEAEHLEVFDEASQGMWWSRTGLMATGNALPLSSSSKPTSWSALAPVPFPWKMSKARKFRWCAGGSGRHAPAGRLCSRLVWIRQQGQRIGLRLLALRLSPEQRDQAQRRKKRKASNEPRNLQADTLSSSRMGIAGDDLAQRAVE